MNPELPQREVQLVLTEAPRLIKVAGITVISFALWHGVNRAIDRKSSYSFQEQIALGYRESCAYATTARLSLLLDSNPRNVSFQSIYKRLKVNSVSTGLLKAIGARSAVGTSGAQDAIDGFLRVYQAVDWSDLHGRLMHFRNIGLAHLTPQLLEKRISFQELETLTRSVAQMAEYLHVLVPDAIPVREDEIRDWSDRAFGMWRLALGGQ